jgi:hypothetical protein
MPLTSSTGPEALDWLKSNHAQSCFAANRFDSTQDAISFVSSCYEAGAERVFIPDDSISKNPKEISEFGGPYADSLVIVLPSDLSINRDQIYSIFEKEAESEGYEDMKASESIIDERYLYLWWD